jgi:anaerobic magnesium-protoporphyrin IX monomethyl ester cyclase
VRTVLLFPPSFSVDQPYLALPALTGWLRTHEVCDVSQIDLNIDSFWYFLDRGLLSDFATNLRTQRTKLERGYANLGYNQRERYETFCEAELMSEPVLERIDEAKNYFKHSPTETDIDEYVFHMRVLSKAFRIVSALYYPTEISLNDINMRYSTQNTADILEATMSPENPYIDYFERDVLPRLVVQSPDIIGMSVACMSQIIPAFTLARMIRQSLPETRLVFGGQVFNRLTDRIVDLPRLFDYVDYFMCREGETALAKLVEHVSGAADIKEVPNLIYFDRQLGRPTRNANTHVEQIDALPCPDFSDLDLTKYLSPVPVLPYQPVRGCYWHRCTFCNHHVVHPEGARAKSPDQVVAEITELSRKYSTRYFAFVNESVHPKLLRKYSEALLNAGLDIEWYVGARLEPVLTRESILSLKKSGCRKMYFGIESGSQRVLNDIDKGVDLNVARRILKDCGEVGMAVHLFILLGFPTERSADLEATKKTMAEMTALVPREGFTYYISIYQLKPCSRVFSNPSAFNIGRLEKCNRANDLEYLYQFTRLDDDEKDYESERINLENVLDQIQNGCEFPENIVHFMTMKHLTRRQSDKLSPHCVLAAQPQLLVVRPGLGWGTFGHYPVSSKHIAGPKKSQHIIYDLNDDEFFLIEDALVWHVLRSLEGKFSAYELEYAIKKASVEADIDSAKLVEKILDCGLVIPIPRVGA